MSKPPDIHAYYSERLEKPGARADRVAAHIKQARLDIAAEAKQLRQELAAEAVQREQGTAAPGDKAKRSRTTTHDWDWIRRRAYHLIRIHDGKLSLEGLRRDIAEHQRVHPSRTNKTLEQILTETKDEYAREQRRDAQKKVK